MIILYSFSDVRPEFQSETREAIRQLSLVRDVLPNHCGSSSAYWNGLRYLWRTDTIINVEQDIVLGERHIYELENCHEPACVFPYRLSDGSWSVGRRSTEPETPFRDLAYQHEPLPDHVDSSGIGLAKISRRVQDQINIDDYPVDVLDWHGIDLWLSAQMNDRGFRWHVHRGSVIHNRPVGVE